MTARISICYKFVNAVVNAVSTHPSPHQCLNLLHNCYHTHPLFYSFVILHHLLHMGLVATKLVFGVSNVARLKPVSSATETR